MNRTKNAKRNMIAGGLYKVVELGSPFVTRTILVYYLGVEYLGLGSLFSSILQVLNMAELGFSRAIIFSLFKPLALKDVKTVCAFLEYYKKIYKIVGTVIFFVGLILLPVVPKLIKGDYPHEINLYILFLIYLINTSISYWMFAYKNALLTAVQRQDIISNVNTIIGILKFIFQIIALIIFKSYYAFICLNIIFTILNNIFVHYITWKMYPEYICEGELNNGTKSSLTQQIKGIAIGKISQAARNSFDSIVLSMFCGLTELAVYSNYFYILTAVTGILGIIIEAISAGVGDSIATESVEKNYEDFKRFNFYYAWISSWFAICLFCLYQPFMKIWVGNDLCASMETVILFCVYFYLLQMGQIRAVYASSAGIWWEFRWIAIAETISNICLNYLLGWKFGMNGILWATIITVFVYSIIAVSIITFHQYFRISVMQYLLSEALYISVSVFVGYITFFICNFISFDGIFELAVVVMVCMIIPNVGFFLLCQCSNTYKKNFEEMLAFCRGMIKNNELIKEK